MRLIKYIILFIVACLGPGSSYAAVVVKAKLDSAQMLMGNLNMLHLQVTQQKGKKGAFTIFKDAQPGGYVTVCGDTVELRTDFSRDTTDISNGNIQIDYSIPIQVFDSGFYKLPVFEYIVDRDTFRSNSVALKVIPVPVTADAEISGYADIVDPAESSIWDSVPDFIVDYWWLILLIILLIAIIVYGIIRTKKKGYLIPKKPEPKPWTLALQELNNLKARKLWEQGEEREYFTRLTDILRIYLDKRFGINAMEMTTTQILDVLSNEPETKQRKDYVQQVLDIADFVKFAAIKTLPSDNVESFNNAVKFIEETIPQEKEDDKNNNKKNNDSGFEIEEDNEEADELITKGGAK